MESWLSDKYELEKPTSLPDQVAAILMEAMKSGELRPGDRLPTEAALSRKFGVSRSVIREATSQLKYAGLLTSRQGRGITVVGTVGRRLFRMEDLDRLTPEELADVYELRTILEGEASAKAAVRRSQLHVTRLKNCLAQMNQAVDSDTSGSLPDLEFHKIIAEASGNAHLSELMQYLNEKILLTIEKARRFTRLKPGLSLEAQKEHQAILEAIESCDPKQARQASLDHLYKTAQRIGLVIPD